MTPIDPLTRDKPEAAMVHAPSAAFFDLPWPWPTSEAVAKPEVPGFDSEAHRAFMRSLS